MKPSYIQLAVSIFAASIITCPATVRYVDVNNPNPATPYTTWATAARVFQDAVDAAVEGDEIVVTNGTYATGGRAVAVCGLTVNRVALDKPVAVRSVNGPVVTIIQGRQIPGTTNGVGAIRCAYLTIGASLSGFTLTGGATEISNYGGGAWCSTSILTPTVVSNCIIMGNAADVFGGGCYWGTVNNCTLIGNVAKGGGGAAFATLNDCLVVSNSATHFDEYGGWGGGAHSGELNRCTIVGNEGSGVYGEGGLFCCMCGLYNCILARNSWGGAVQWAEAAGSTGTWNCYIGGDPRFVDEAAGDLRLRSDSPCINAGRNDHAPAGTDLDGNPRIVGGAVDIGAFEFQSPQSTLSYWWLQQYALPTDGSADFADTDSDGHNNWQEWRADTVPTNALSRLALLGVTNAPGRVGVTWQSVATRYYFLERATNLSGAHPFMSVQTGIPGQAGTTSFTDTNVSGGGPFFYRVGVRAP